MLLAQHDLLPKIGAEKRTPVTVLKDVVRGRFRQASFGRSIDQVPLRLS